MTKYTKGTARERQVRKLLEDEGWVVFKTSEGPVDLLATRSWDLNHPLGLDIATELRLIQVKTDKDSPWANFRPSDRQELLRLAGLTGGVAELAWWPPRGKLEWFEPDRWPPS